MHVLRDAVPGETPGDPDASRLLMISNYCEAFECTPLVARHELDTDPEHLGLLIMDIRNYLACKRDFDGAKDVVKDLAQWEHSPYLTLVESHTFELREARRAAVLAQDEPVNG